VPLSSQSSTGTYYPPVNPMNQTIIVLAGMPGAGKTTVGIALSRALGIPMLDKDTLKAPLLAAGIAEQVAAPTAYELFFALARDLVVVQGQSVILDSPTIYPRILATARMIAGEVGATVKIVACRVDFATRQSRMAIRERTLSQLAADPTPDSTAAEWFAHLPPDTLWLDTAQPLAQLLQIALPYVTTE
jgi:predicted kinase